MPQWFKYVCCMAGGAVLLLAAAIYNGYPLVNSDTGAYILNAFALYIPKDRPLTYSVFLRLSSLGHVLWLTVAAQALLLAYLLSRSLELLTGRSLKVLHHIAMFAVLGIGTTISWCCSQLMPDIFTAIVFLAAVLFLLSPQRAERRFLLLVLWGAIMMHHSNLLSSCGFILIMTVYYLLTRQWRRYRQQLLSLAGIVLLGGLTVCTENAIAGRGFRPSDSGHIFIMGRLAENGVLKAYLQAHCDEAAAPDQLCAYKDQLPVPAWQFIWLEDGILMKTGGWDSSAAAYNAVLRDICTDPHYLWMNLQVNTRDAFRELGLGNAMDGIHTFGKGSSPYERISQLMPAELKRYSAARQQRQALGVGDTGSYYTACLVCFVLLAVAVSCLYGCSRRLLRFSVLCLLFVFLNAWVTVSFANVLDRLNTRVIWLIPLCCYIIIADACWRRGQKSTAAHKA